MFFLSSKDLRASTWFKHLLNGKAKTKYTFGSIGELNVLVRSFLPSVTSSSGSNIDLERDFWSKKNHFMATKTKKILDVVINFADIVKLHRV